MRDPASRDGVVTMLGEIGVVLLVALIVAIARRYSVSAPPMGEPSTGTTDVDVGRLVAQGRKIDAIKLYRRLHGTDLKTAKDAIDAIELAGAGPAT